MGILEIHGVADAEKVMAVGSRKQRVTIIDAQGRVFVELSDPPAAGLTPDRARLLGKQLIEAAERVEKQPKK